MAILRKAVIPANLMFFLGLRGLHGACQLTSWQLWFYLIAASALQVLAWAIWSILLWPKYFSPLIGLPEPSPPSWWNGHADVLAIQPTGIPLRHWLNSVPNDGIIRYLGPLNQERLLVTSDNVLPEVLVRKSYTLEKPPLLRNVIGTILGVGLLHAEGDEHRIQRRKLLPAFSTRQIRGLYPIFWRKSCEGVEALEHDMKEAATSIDSDGFVVVEICDYALRTTLDIIGVAAMGHDFQAIHNPHNKLSTAYHNLFSSSKAEAQFLGALSFVLPFRWCLRLPIPATQKLREAAQALKSICRGLVVDAKARGPEKANKDILSTAVESGLFTDEGLVDQLMTFLAAGHETTATVLVWSIYLLCRHPDMQTRLRSEIRAGLMSPMTKSNHQLSSTEVDKLPYLRAVCNECLRFHNPVPIAFREALTDMTLGGHHIPKGTRVVLSPWAVNFDKKLWGEDADRFDPERWLESPLGGASSKYAFMSFLHGPHSCIGQAMGRSKLACMLAAFVGRFEFALRDAEEGWPNIKREVTAAPAEGMFVRVKVVPGW